MLKLLLYISLIACVFAPWGLAPSRCALGRAHALALVAYVAKLAVGRLAARAVRDDGRQDARIPCAGFLGVALMLGLLATLLRFISRGL